MTSLLVEMSLRMFKEIEMTTKCPDSTYPLQLQLSLLENGYNIISSSMFKNSKITWKH